MHAADDTAAAAATVAADAAAAAAGPGGRTELLTDAEVEAAIHAFAESAVRAAVPKWQTHRAKVLGAVQDACRTRSAPQLQHRVVRAVRLLAVHAQLRPHRPW